MLGCGHLDLWPQIPICDNQTKDDKFNMLKFELTSKIMVNIHRKGLKLEHYCPCLTVLLQRLNNIANWKTTSAQWPVGSLASEHSTVLFLAAEKSFG